MEYSRSLVRSLDKSSRITLSASDHVTAFHLQDKDCIERKWITHQNTCYTKRGSIYSRKIT